MRTARRISQAFFFALFIFLLIMTEYKGTDEIKYPVKIFFDFDKYSLRPESFPELNRLAKILQEHPDRKVEISGHTCSIGTEAYNLDLSNRRAKSVINYLISIGCDGAKLMPKGYGESMPIASNEIEDGRAQNRRVEFRFLKQ